MDQLKRWVTLSVALSMLILAAGWFLLVSPKRSEAADLRLQTSEQVSANSVLEIQLQVLKAQAKDLPKEQAKLAAVSAKLPDHPALPSLVRALLEASAKSGVELVSVAPGTAALVAPAVVAPVVAPAQGQTTGEEGAPAATDPAAPPTGPAGALANIPVTINVVGDYFEVQQFLAALETMPRALRVQDLAIVPGSSPTDTGEISLEDGRRLTTTITGFVFMAADRPTPAAVRLPGEAVPVEAPVESPVESPGAAPVDAPAPADAPAEPAATTATPAG